MAKTAVIIGAGNIGRGFIGQIMSEGGYHLCYIDVMEAAVNVLNERGEYPLEIVYSGGSDKKIIRNVSAVNGNDHEAAARAIADADICVTCVGAKAVKYIIPNFAAGVKLRYAEKKGPINLLICENLMDADKYIRSLLEEVLTADELASVGLVETSVGRMVPLPDKALLKKDPLLVRAEAYPVLPCDRAAFKGEIPAIANLIPISPFRFIIERKLYVHNMGHAVCAYLGMLKGYTYICEAIADPEIRVIVREAMTESVCALSARYNQSLSGLIGHTNDLIRRFGNTALGDTCERVGADIPRKLAKTDRLSGASLSVLEAGGHPVYTALGAAAALIRYEPENAAEAFDRMTGVTDGEYRETALALYAMLKNGASLSDVIAAADARLAALTGIIM
ncbi:MAG: mannitol dehydrogenase [Clostridia bacterium]|nr:mannitol dehydrogenase [Clostridia bacterium]